MGYLSWAWNMGYNMKLVSFDLENLIFKTGQTTSYADYDDGYYEKGRKYPGTRFIDVGDGTVFDNATGLYWEKSPGCLVTINYFYWANAITYCATLADDDTTLTDGSSAGDWRLPNINELFSLIDFSNYNNCLPTGHPFTDVTGPDEYWSSTTNIGSTFQAWAVSIQYGTCRPRAKDSTHHYVWAVRNG